MNYNNIPYQNNYFGENVTTPYVRGENTQLPQPMTGNLTEDQLYPLESSLATPQLNSTPQANFGYAKGGMVKKHKAPKRPPASAVLPSLAELIRQQGSNEDSILAHINPLEAMILKSIGGSGKINPRTGLPQFGLFKNPGKWLKSVVGPTGGAIAGNMLLPGIGGIIGGAVGGAAGSTARGRKDHLQSALRGGAIGGVLPSMASLLGQGASSLGMQDTAGTLSDYGDQNAIMPSLGKLIGSNPAGTGSAASMGATGSIAPKAEKGFLEKLTNNSEDFLSKPKNLLALGSAAAAFAGRPKPKKEKSPEAIANDQKRFAKASILTPEERAVLEAEKLATRQMERRIERNQYLPEERFAVVNTYRKTHSPEEYAKNKKWFSYYDNPEMAGNPLMMKKGGLVPGIEIEEIEFNLPGNGVYFKGDSKGQADAIEAELSDGEYVIPADVVSHAGDGNSNAGGKEFDKFVAKVRKAKGAKNKLPPKLKSLTSYMMR